MARKKKAEIVPDGVMIQSRPIDATLVVVPGCPLCELTEEGRKDVKLKLDSGELSVIDVAAMYGMSVGRVFEHQFYHHTESAYLQPSDGIDYYLNSLNGMIHKLQSWFLHISDTKYPDATNVTQVTNLAKEIRSCLHLMSSLDDKLGQSKSVQDFENLKRKYSDTLRHILDISCDECQGKILDYLAENND